MARSTVGSRSDATTRKPSEAPETETGLTDARWTRYELTGETIDHAEVRAWLTSLDRSGKSASD